MKIVKRLGNNAAVALDSHNKEVVVFGKGVGFPSIPYDLNDLSIIERTFYNVNSKYFDMISSIDEDVMQASADIVEQAELNLEKELSTNIVFTLADHLQFAIERHGKGINIGTPLAYDIIHLYPDEYELGVLGLDIVMDYVHVQLPSEEAVSIALHIINCELENGNDIHNTMTILNVISEVDELIETELNFKIDKDSYFYSRFVMHLRYLIQRLKTDNGINEPIGNIFNSLAKEYPEVYSCCLMIQKHLEKKYDWICTKEEITFLMIHVIRLLNRSV